MLAHHISNIFFDVLEDVQLEVIRSDWHLVILQMLLPFIRKMTVSYIHVAWIEDLFSKLTIIV